MAAGLAVDIVRWLIIIEATIGFVNGLGLTDTHSFQQDVNNESSYETGDLSDLAEEQSGTTGGISYFDTLVTYFVGGLIMIAYMAMAIACILPFLVSQFHIPLLLATLLQVGIYWVYYTAIIELKMKVPLRQY